MTRWRISWLTRLRGDRGSVSVIAAAIAFPAIIALLAGFFQAALWFAARSAALAAAQQGTDTARRTGATLAQGEAAACGFARSAGGGMLRSPSCTGRGGATITITITVCGNAPSFVPLFPVKACEQAQGARERFTTRTGEFSNSERRLGPDHRQQTRLIGVPGRLGARSTA